jgi:hypothetical protein
MRQLPRLQDGGEARFVEDGHAELLGLADLGRPGSVPATTANVFFDTLPGLLPPVP